MQMSSHEHPKGSPTNKSAMNKKLYYGIITYLRQQKMPQYLEEWTQMIISRTWKQFETNREILKKGKLLVIPEYKKEQVMKSVHKLGYLGGTNTYNKARR